MPSRLAELACDYVMIGDGSGTNKCGGWSVILIDMSRGGAVEIFGGAVTHATNNIMELEGFVVALACLLRRGKRNARVLICTDSELVVRCAQGEYTPRANTHLWAAFFDLQERFTLYFQHIPRNSFPMAAWVDETSRTLRLRIEGFLSRVCPTVPAKVEELSADFTLTDP